MVYTVTLNPSLDYIVRVPGFQMGKTNRTTQEQIFPGGKGINVSIALQKLGIRSKPLGFLAGFSGKEILTLLNQLQITGDFIILEQGNSRINVKIQNPEGTEINGTGPEIDECSLALLADRLDTMVSGDILVLSGSIPPTLPVDIYGKLTTKANQKGILTIVDASGDTLREVLASHPFLIKPNQQELEEFFGIKICNTEQAIPYARKLQEMGTENVLISMGSQGALLLTQDGDVYTANAPQGNAKNTVGAGDAMIAGFLGGWIRSKDYPSALRLAVASGSASAFSEHFGEKEDILKLLETVAVRKI